MKKYSINDIRKFRMYGLVNYQLSGIQQGIQYGHGVVEYCLENFTNPDFQKWAQKDKVFIILNGGTTNSNPERFGTLNFHKDTLHANGINISCFYEPDLGDQLTSIVFLVDDRIFDKSNWPNYEDVVKEYIDAGGGDYCPTYEEWKNRFSENEDESNKIVFLRKYLKQFRLA